MLLDADDCQLVLVDYQARLMPNIHEHGAVLHNAVRLGRMLVPATHRGGNTDVDVSRRLPGVPAPV